MPRAHLCQSIQVTQWLDSHRIGRTFEAAQRTSSLGMLQRAFDVPPQVSQTPAPPPYVT
jgi:hypothetical protein